MTTKISFYHISPSFSQNVKRFKVVERIKNSFHVQYRFFENRAVSEIMWKFFVEQGRPQKIMCMRTACWIPNATNTHSEYLIFIDFQLQQWLLLLQTNKAVTSNVEL